MIERKYNLRVKCLTLKGRLKKGKGGQQNKKARKNGQVDSLDHRHVCNVVYF
jgi:hypothetical protein